MSGAALLTLAGSTQLSDEAVDRGIALLAGASWAKRTAGTEDAGAEDVGAGDAGEADAGTRSGSEALSAETRETLREAMSQRLRRAMPKPTAD